MARPPVGYANNTASMRRRSLQKIEVLFCLKTELKLKTANESLKSRPSSKIAHAATIFWSRFEDVCGSEFLW